MEWQPIATYDKLKKKPKLAVFWFAGTPPARGQLGEYGLYPCMRTDRYMGSRTCLYWIPLPEVPKEN